MSPDLGANAATSTKHDGHHLKLPLLLAVLSILASLVWLRSTSPLQASALLPNGFAESTVALLGASAFPTDMERAPDGRIFVTQKYGQVRIIKDGALLTTPFVSVSTDGSNERGLVGITLDPAFSTNGYVYLHYTLPTSPARDRISRFTASGDQAVAGSEFVLTELEPQQTSFHKAGGMKFGADGKLYIVTGNDNVDSTSQSMTTRLGKVLRINKDGTIPSDNPFYLTAVGDNRMIWALGLRNPFKLAVQPGTGRIYINDVGYEAWEEINNGVAGANYGWPICEGPCSPSNPSYTDPLFAYGHGNGDVLGRAITGGAFYNPTTTTFPSQYTGKYFYGDYVNGWIRTFDPATRATAAFMQGVPNIVDVEVGNDGALYYLTIAEGTLSEGKGAVRRVQYTGNSAPQIGQQPVSITVAEGSTASFEVRASGAQPLGYQWQKNGVNISGATSSIYTTTLVTMADNGAQFRAVITNTADTATSNAAVLTVAGNGAPTATITVPVEGTLYSGGETINFAGTGTDSEEGALPASAYTWQVDFHHDTHVHPGYLPPTSGITSGSFMIATEGETAANVWYRITLTVQDSQGTTSSTFRDVRPRTSTITLTTNPPGLQVSLDGTPHIAPYSVLGVVGVQRGIGVLSPQIVNGVPYEFASWSDGQTATHAISTPATNTTYTATLVPCDGPCVSNLSAIYSSDPPTSWQTGETITYDVTLTNNGLETWTWGGDQIVRLAVSFGSESDWPHDGWVTDERFMLPHDVAPGESVTLSVAVTAPNSVNGYVLRHRMVKENVAWFEQMQKTTVEVGPPLVAAYTGSPPTSWRAGETKSYDVTVTNQGSQTWNWSGTQIVRLAVSFGGASDWPHDGWITDQRFLLPRDVKPGESVTVNVTVTAPLGVGSYVLRHRMVKEDVAWFDQQQKANVAVTSNDTTPPVISNVTATDISPTSVRITWTTNELANSQVRYGKTSGLGSSTPVDVVTVTSHSMVLTGLEANTNYRYRVRSVDNAGNETISSEFRFKTTR